jgi:hypothetical protein
MKLRLTLLLGLALGLAGLVFGTLGHTQASRSSDSPYVSSLSDFAVGTAEAVACNTKCNQVSHNPPFWNCVDDPGTGMFCHYALDHTSCFNDVCP